MPLIIYIYIYVFLTINYNIELDCQANELLWISGMVWTYLYFIDGFDDDILHICYKTVNPVLSVGQTQDPWLLRLWNSSHSTANGIVLCTRDSYVEKQLMTRRRNWQKYIYMIKYFSFWSSGELSGFFDMMLHSR